MEKAVFNLQDYCFTNIQLRLSDLEDENTLSLGFEPRGIFEEEKKLFKLIFDFKAVAEKSGKVVAEVTCEADYQFRDAISFEEIPLYFFSNSIAIVFPYLRAMVSTLTLQSNMKRPIILPTMNLSSLQDQLRSQVEIR